MSYQNVWVCTPNEIRVPRRRGPRLGQHGIADADLRLCKFVHTGWSTEDAIESLYRKAGFYGTVTKELLQSSRVTRYQSSIESMYYHEYKQAAVLA